MATQYTSILKLALPTEGELSGTWGDVVNDNITSMVEEAIAGRAVIDSWTANGHTLTTADGTTAEARCAMLEFTDTNTDLTGNAEVICPTASKIYIAKNATGAGYSVTVKTSAGTGIAVPDGETMFLFCDGTNVVEAVTSVKTLKIADGVQVNTILDEDNMASDSATALATQQSIKAYVDAQVTAQELDIAGDSGTGAIDLDSQSLTVAGTANEIETAASGQTITVGLPSAVIVTTSVTTPTVQATNINANDGSTSATIADSTGVMTIASAVLTTADINGGTIDDTVIGGSTAAAGTFTTATTTTGVVTDTISERTATSGVTIDGVVLKDNGIIATGGGSLTGTWSDLGSVTTVDINGGTIDGVTIGGASAGAITGTTITGTSFVSSGDMTFGDDDKAIFGAGSDLQIYHDGSNSYIKDAGTGTLNLQSSDTIRLQTSDGAGGFQNVFAGVDEGAAFLYYDGADKLATTATGIDVIGTVTADGLTVDGFLQSTFDAQSNGGDTSHGLVLRQATTDTKALIAGYSTSGTLVGGAYIQAVNFGTAYEDLFIQPQGGNVGIGTTSPSSYQSNADNLVVATTGHTGITIASGASHLGNIHFADGTSGDDAYRGFIQYEHTANYMRFATNALERLRIDSNGDISFYEDMGVTAKLFWNAVAEGLSIGTTSNPNNSPLLIRCASDDNIRISQQTHASIQSVNDAASAFTELKLDGSSLLLNSQSLGNVGIGATSPGARLTVAGVAPAASSPATYPGTIQINETALSTLQSTGGLEFRGAVFGSGYGSKITSSDTGDLLFGNRSNSAAWTKTMHLSASGNLGLGVTPSAWSANYKAIQSGNGSAFAGFNGNDQTFVVSNAYNDGAWKYKNSAGAGRYTIQGVANGVHAWFTAPSGTAGDAITFTQAMTLDASGNLLVGKTSQGFGTSGTEIRADDSLYVTRTDTTAFFNRLSTDGDIVKFYKDSSTVGSIGYNTSALTLDGGSSRSGLYFGDGAILPRYNSSLVNGVNADLGATTQRFQDLYLSGSVYLGGTTSANALDDYEEGVWTPEYVPATSFSSITYDASTTGRYTKVGNIVTASGRLRTDAISGGSGAVSIGALPFTVLNSTGGSVGGVVVHVAGDFAGDMPISGEATANTTTALLRYRSAANGASLQLDVSDLGTGADDNLLFFTIVYTAA
jgi:hypothetical protein